MTEQPFDPTEVPIPPGHETVGITGHDTALTEVRAARILRLKAAGATYAAIAEAEGYTDPATARNTLLRALRRYNAEAANDLRIIENERLDIGLSVIVPLLRHEDPMVRLRAHAELMRNSKRRADMNGLDAPKQVQISAGVLAEMDAAFGQLRLVVSGEATDVTEEPPALEA